MVIRLEKGMGINLNKQGETLTKVRLGMGWDPSRSSAVFDLDASAFMLGSNGKATREEDFVFYNNLSDASGALEHSVDDRTGGSSLDGDDEYIIVDLSKVQEKYDKIIFVVTIDEYESRRQNFGMVDNAYVRLINEQDGSEIARFDLTEDMSTATALTFCELKRESEGWSFNIIGQGENVSLTAFLMRYGLA